MGFKRHEVNHLYSVFRHVIGLWFSLVNSPGLGIKVTLMQTGCLFPPEVGETVWSFLLDYFSACFSAKLGKVRWGS